MLTLCLYSAYDIAESPSWVLAGQFVESDGSEEAAEAVENLLESYFMQIDGTYDRLVSICKLPSPSCLKHLRMISQFHNN